MHRRLSLVAVITLAFALLLVPEQALTVVRAGPLAQSTPLGTAFTYQGELKQNGVGVTAICSFQFKLFADSSGTTQLGSTQTVPGVTVTNGLFTAFPLDFGAGPLAQTTWLQAAATCPGGSATFPLQRLTPAPNTVFSELAANATTAGTATSFSGSLAGDVTGTQAATVVSTVGGQTASSVANAVSAVSAATSANTANTLARRDGTGSLTLQSLTLAANLALPNTNSAGTVGLLALGGNRFLHNAGTNNTFVGALAGAFSTPGNNNTAVGAAALQNIAGGTGNAALGSSALLSNTTGSSNTAVGTSALQSNTTGDNNTAIGSSALQSNTIAAQNTAVGTNALATNTAGGSNTAVGFSALQSNTVGSDNAAFGFGALSRTTTGDTNAAVGSRALFLNTTGGSNTAVGHGALQNTTTGSSNTAVGDGALGATTTGGSNIAVGAAAGALLTSGNNNILIGAGAGSATELDTIRIGNTQTRAFIAGIANTAVNNSASVLIDTSTGQLGTIVSSRRFKDAIADLGVTSEVLYQLRPVSFVYKPEIGGHSNEPQAGLIAEEVAEVAPWLVAYDDAGQPFTVRYQELPPLLLNELQAQQRTIAQQASEQAALRAQLAAQDAALARLQAQVAALAAQAAPREALEARRAAPEQPVRP